MSKRYVLLTDLLEFKKGEVLKEPFLFVFGLTI